MKQQRAMRPRSVLIALLPVLMGLLIAPAAPAFSQTEIGGVEILSVDATNFPEVRLHARVMDANGMPLPTPLADALVLAEDDAERPFELQPIDAGVQTALVVDLAVDSSAPGATGAARGDEVRALINRFLDDMAPPDRAALYLANTNGVAILQPMTTEQESLRTSASLIQPTPEGEESLNGPGALLRALQDMNGTAEDGQAQAVLYISTGTPTGGEVSTAEVEGLAASLGIPVHVVLCSDVDGQGSIDLVGIAQKSGGQYVHYTTADSVLPLFSWLRQERGRFELTFRSSLSTSGQRTLTLAARPGGPASPQDSTTYVVEVLPPAVVLDQPTNGTEFMRQALAGQALDTVQPTTATITAHVDWPDGHPRDVRTAQLYVDGQPYGTAQPEPGTGLSFAWDLRPFRSQGQTTAQLQVQVTDELGFIALSPPVLVTVAVDIPLTPTSEGSNNKHKGCANAGDLVGQIVCYVNSMAGIAALVLAIPTLIIAIVAWHNRGRNASGVMGRVGESITDIVARVTRPVDNGHDAAAYLYVLRGDPYLVGKRFPIYASTVTPIGRDKSQVEIVFPDEENSVISRKHCEIRQEDEGFKLRDFASTYGTYLNGMKLPELSIEALHHGDEISLGPIERGGVLMRFEVVVLDDDMPEDFRDTQPAPD